MRIICDAPGQTCNRLWSYVSSIAQCIAEQKKMMIIFYDWTIEDFPNLLNCPFIYFPLWQKWYLERGNGWNNYKGLTWKVTHNKTWDKIFKLLGCTKGWYTRANTRYLKQTFPELKRIFCPKMEITKKAETFMENLRKNADIVVGIHIRHGDYKTFCYGRFYYTLEEYHQFMIQIKNLYPNKRVSFFISSNENFSTDIFTECQVFRFEKEPSGAILDLHTLSLCDLILGPWSTYSRWASFIGEVPLCLNVSNKQELTEEDFSVVKDFFHFENGKSTEDIWVKEFTKPTITQ